jgi:hypothetical protein
MPFAFDPQRDHLSDMAFQAVIDDVSANGTLQYTPAQLHLATSRRLGHKLKRGFHMGCSIPIAIALMFVSAWLLGVLRMPEAAFWWVFLLMTAFGASPLVLDRLRRRRVLLSWAEFQGLLSQWRSAHGEPKGLLSADSARVKALTAQQRAELSHYSFDRLLVVERDAVALMLVRNHFHFENNCAILSLEGYPGDETRGVVLEMARQNPALKVFIAHDASPSGCAALATLRRKGWLPASDTPVMDLGLRPSQVRALRRPQLARDQAVLPANADDLAWLTPKERQWLAKGNAMSLEALGPAALMRALHQGFARAQMLAARPEDDDGAAVVVAGGDYAIWSGAGSYDQFASDSFG